MRTRSSLLWVLTIATFLTACGTNGASSTRSTAGQRLPAPVRHAAVATGAVTGEESPCPTTLGPGQNPGGGDPGAAIAATLRKAHGGAVICLAAGGYDVHGHIDLHDISPSETVTLMPAPGAVVHLGWLDINAVSNLTIRGFHLDGGVSDTGAGSNDTFENNTISGADGATLGFFFYGNGGQQTNINVLNNRMDHLAGTSGPGAGQCVTINGGRAIEHNFTVSGNTCGPGIGIHYLQVGGIDGLKVERNTFLGPPAPIAQQQGFHNNVFQLFGDSENIDFSNNVIRNTGSRGQTIVVDSSRNLRVNNNLVAEDPACLTNVNCYSYAFAACKADGLQFTHNTIIDSYWGVQITNTGNAACDGTSGIRYTVTNNVFARPDGKGGNPEVDYAECTSSCTFDYNVSDDGSVRSQHSVLRWSARWADAGSFRPAGLPFTAGYRAGG